MKYVVRRAIASVVIIPAIAGMYLVAYALLLGMAIEPTARLAEVWNTGLVLGAISSFVFILTAPMVGKEN